jgi:hypothetical protein
MYKHGECAGMKREVKYARVISKGMHRTRVVSIIMYNSESYTFIQMIISQSESQPKERRNNVKEVNSLDRFQFALLLPLLIKRVQVEII